MVRARSLVKRGLVVLGAMLAVSATSTGELRAQAPAPATDAADAGEVDRASIPFERRPYRIRTWLDIRGDVRLDEAGREVLVGDWLALVRRFVGAPWDLDVEAGPGPLRDATPAEIGPDDLATLVEGADKLWMIQVGSNGRGGYLVTGRSFDARTGLLGAVQRAEIPFPRDAARRLLQLGFDLFTPTAEIRGEDGGAVRLAIQAGALTPHDPVGAVARQGSLFVPVRVFFKPDGTIRQSTPIGWSYLKVDELESSSATCSVVSSLRNPLSRRIMGRHELVAVGIKPAPVPTAFRFETQAPEPRPAAGYTLTWRAGADTPTRVVGTTDRDGRIVLPAGLAGDLVTLRLLAGGVEPLVEFPVVPGETTDERVVRVNPLSEAVAVEAKLDALRDVVVDQVAIRARLEALLSSRIEGGAWDDAQVLLDEFRRLPPGQTYVDQLESIQADARAQQQERKVPVLTRTAQARVADTESLILRYLGNDALSGFEDALRAGMGGQAAASAPRGWVEVAPPSGGYRVSMPGVPTEEVGQADSGTPMRTLTYEGSGGLSFAIAESEIIDGGAIATADPNSIQDALRRGLDLYIASKLGATLKDERNVRVDDLRGSEVVLELPAGSPGIEKLGNHQRVRAYISGSGRNYLLMVQGSDRTIRAPEADQFFNSFRLTSAPALATDTPSDGEEPPKIPARQPAGAVAF